MYLSICIRGWAILISWSGRFCLTSICNSRFGLWDADDRHVSIHCIIIIYLDRFHLLLWTEEFCELAAAKQDRSIPQRYSNWVYLTLLFVNFIIPCSISSVAIYVCLFNWCLSDGFATTNFGGEATKFVINGPILRESKAPQPLQKRHKDVQILLFWAHSIPYFKM